MHRPRGGSPAAGRAGRGQRAAVAVAATVALLGGAAEASAQPIGGQRYAPETSQDGVLGTEGADTRIPLRPYASLTAHYALRPVVLRSREQDDDDIVRHLAGADLVASMAVWRGLEFGVRLPVHLYFDGDGEGLEASGTDLGELTLQVGYRLRLGPDTALALHVPVLLPTSVTEDGEQLGLGLGARPTVAFMQRIGIVELLANVSYLVRGNESEFDYDGGQELGASVAARVALDDAWRTSLLAQVGFSTATRDFFGPAVTPVEGRAGIEHWLTEHWRIGGFAGMGLTQGVGAPDARVGVTVAYGDHVPYRPRPHPKAGDRDGDGILDVDDECPTDPEDLDGFEDEDGCPDGDNDKDGVLDIHDRCPEAPETVNGVSDDDGCPEKIRLDDTLITTFESVHFRTDSAEILPRSHPMLREVANVLKANESMRIRVEGHTDGRGDDEYNRRLSQRRAESVRRFLIREGIRDDRIVAKGVGEAEPIAPNDTPAGRRKNRRVEFHILAEE